MPLLWKPPCLHPQPPSVFHPSPDDRELRPVSEGSEASELATQGLMFACLTQTYAHSSPVTCNCGECEGLS